MNESHCYIISYDLCMPGRDYDSLYQALKEMEQPPMTEEEGQKMFKDIPKKLQISEEELQSYYERGYDGRK